MRPIPSVPAKLDPQLRNFLSAVREALNSVSGLAGGNSGNKTLIIEGNNKLPSQPGGLPVSSAADPAYEINFKSKEFWDDIGKLATAADTYTYTGLLFKPNNPSANRVTWSAGTSTKNGDETWDIAAETTGVLWESGILYIYYIPGQTALSTSTSLLGAIEAGGRILATYKGGTDLTNDAGRAFIDGDTVLAGTIGASQLVTNTAVITTAAQIANAIITNAHIGELTIDYGQITDTLQSSNYSFANHTGWRLNKDGGIVAHDIAIFDSAGNIVMAAGNRVDFAHLMGSTKPANNATKNFFYRQGGTVPTGQTGDLWYVTAATSGYTTGATYIYTGGAWAITSDSTLTQLAGSGVNILNPRYMTFGEATLPPVSAFNGTATLDAVGFFGGTSLKLTASAADNYAYLGLTNADYNFQIQPNKKWIVSAVVKASAASKQYQLYVATSNSGAHYNVAGVTSVTIGEWTRISGVIDLSADASTKALFRVDNDGGAGVSMWFDGLMMEQQIGDLSTPSAFSMSPNFRTDYVGDLDATKGAPAGTLVAGVSASTVATAATNFNASNDRNGAAVVAPTINADGTAVDHTLQANGSADISFEWNWSGAEGDIDGFLIYVYQSASSGAYTFGTTPAAETVYTVPAAKRAFILFGVIANQYYTFGVRAYRSVDKDVNAAGVIQSSIVKSTIAGENPYQPSANVAFSGNVTGTVNGIAAASVNVWSSISGAGKPENNATVGANGSNLAIGVGGNMVGNSDFESVNIDDWTFFWQQTAGGSYSISRDIAGSSWVPAGGHQLGFSRSGSTGAAAGSFAIQYSKNLSVIPSRKYELSAYVASHRCDTQIFVKWFKLVAGVETFISDSVFSPASRSGGGQSLSAWSRVGGIATPPADAQYCRFMFLAGAVDGGQSDPYAFITRAFLAEALSNQTELTPWSRAGSVGNFSNLDQITSSNISTFIANAAIQNAQIGNAAIGTANIADAAISSAKIADASILSAKIGTAAVDTLKIAGNAVTIPVSATSGTDQTITGTGTFAQVISANITVGDSVPILINVGFRTNCQYFYSDGGFLSIGVSKGYQFRIKRGSTIIFTADITNAWSVNEGVSYIDTPGSGTYTYSLEVSRQTVGAADSLVILDSWITLLGVKR